tara:strand:+ start:2119 stop:4515 length:2397 start_codon:yes stop_codon:yes gene_type:complete
VSTTDPIVIHLQAKDDGVNEVFDSAERAIRKQKKAVDDTLKRMKQYHRTLGMTKQELEIFRLKQNGATDAQVRAAKRMAQLTAAKERNIATNKKLNGSLRMIRGGFGQVGHQLQDITIQAQMGTDAFIILGQQGSQIASLFGSKGAMYGAVLAVGAALVTFLKNTYGASDSLKELKESSDEIAELFSGSLLAGINDVTEELIDLSKASKQMALTKVVLAQIEATKNLSDAQRLFNKELVLTEQITQGTTVSLQTVDKSLSSLNRQFGVGMDKVGEFKRLAQGLTTDLDANKDAFLAFATPLREEGVGTRQFNDLIDSVVEYGLQAMVAKKQISELADVRRRLGDGPLQDDPEKDKRSRQQLQSVIDGNAIKTLKGEEQIRAVMKKRIDDTLDAMQKLGKTEEEQQQMKLALEGELSRQISDMQNKRLQEFNKLDDARQKDAANLEKSRAQMEAVHQQELTGLDAINQKYDLRLQKVENLAATEPRLLAEASAKIIQINADRAAAIDKFHDDQHMANVKALEKDRQEHLKHRESIQKMMDDGKNAFMQDLQARAYALEVALAKRAIDEAEYTEFRKQLQTEYADHVLQENLKIVGGLKNVEDSFVNASHAFITGAQNGTEAIQQFGRAIVDELIKSLVQMGVEHVKQMVIKKQIEAKGLGQSVAMNAGAMTAIAAASAPAAALVSLATAGGNSAPAVTGMGTAFAASRAMSLATFDGGGFTGMGARSGGMDGKGGFPAILHPNETVVDHTRGQGQGITIINNIDASGNQDVDEKIAIAVTQSSRQTVEQVHNMMRRGRL